MKRNVKKERNAIKPICVVLVALIVFVVLIAGIAFAALAHEKDDDTRLLESANIVPTTESVTEATQYPSAIESYEPAVSEPETAKPEDTMPEASEPEITEPEAIEAEETDPEATEPETETVYTTRDVNVRKGPGTDHEKIGRLARGEAVERIQAQEDGWSQIIYNGEVAYVHSDYLSKTKPQAQKPSGNNNSSSDNSDNSGGNGGNASATEPEETTSSNREQEKKEALENLGVTEEESEAWVEAAQTCQHCGGKDGPYHRWIRDVTCPKCGAEVSANTCHYC